MCFFSLSDLCWLTVWVDSSKHSVVSYTQWSAWLIHFMVPKSAPIEEQYARQTYNVNGKYCETEKNRLGEEFSFQSCKQQLLSSLLNLWKKTIAPLLLIVLLLFRSTEWWLATKRVTNLRQWIHKYVTIARIDKSEIVCKHILKWKLKVHACFCSIVDSDGNIYCLCKQYFLWERIGR